MRTYPLAGIMNINRRAYTTGEKRAPKRGEYYLSGAIPEVYKAAGDFPADSKFYICKLVEKDKK